MDITISNVFCGWCKQPRSKKCSCEKLIPRLTHNDFVDPLSYRYRFKPFQLEAALVIFKGRLVTFYLMQEDWNLITHHFHRGLVVK